MKKIFSLMLIFTLSILLICCNEGDKEIEMESKGSMESSIINSSSNNIESSSAISSSEALINESSNVTSSNIESSKENDEIDYSHAIFASPNGLGDGSVNNPCSILDGINKLSMNNNELYLYPGTYNLNQVIVLNDKGTNDSYYKISSLQSGKVILDFGKNYRESQVINGYYNKEKAKGIVIKGEYYHIKGLTVTNCASSGIHLVGSYNIVENCILAYNGNTGLNISSPSTNPKETWAHDNLVLNCTSYGNYDWDRETNQGEDADGFACKLTSGANNVFDGCISYNNSDDGWDLFTKQKTGAIGSVTIKNCVAFNNGYSILGEDLKNGNGFKLGGRAIEVDHFVTNSIAFNNKANGFDDNSNPGTITLKNCTGYNNGKRNFATGRFLDENNTYTSTWYEGEDLMGPIENVPKSHNIYENIISYNGALDDSYSGSAINCYFYSMDNGYNYFENGSCNSKYNIGNQIDLFNPFNSEEIDLSDLDNIQYLYRNSDNTVNLNGFLKIKDNYSFGASL